MIENMKALDEVGIIYMSCDKYSDLWIEYFRLFRRNWPECPFKIYVLTNTTGPSIEGVEKLEVGKDITWSDNLLAALERVGHRYVLLLLDDFFLVDRVPGEWVAERIRWAVENDVNCLRLSPGHPKPVEKCDHNIGLIPKGAIYRTSVRFPLWKKETLRKVLKRGESAWDFELAGSYRSDEFDHFYAIYSEPFKFANCIIKGRWDPRALRLVERHGVRLNLSTRPMMSTAQCCLEFAKGMRSLCLLLFPYGSRRKIRQSVLRAFGRAT